MYESHFGLKGRPFGSLPTPSIYYPATGHEQALSSLQRALADDEGLMLLTGEAGTGKTLLCHCLLQRMGAIQCAFLTNSHVRDRSALLQAILYEMGLPHQAASEQSLRLALTDHLLQNWAQEGSTVLLVDEAHHLTPDLLEELRLLGNLESDQGRAIQIVLVGQPTLLKLLQLPELTSLRQRLAVRAQVEPLEPVELVDFLYHRIRLVGGRPEKLLLPDAAETIAIASGGAPRMANQIAHLSCCLAYEAQADVVDLEAVLEALTRLDIEVEVSMQPEEVTPEHTRSLPKKSEEAIWKEVLSMDRTSQQPHTDGKGTIKDGQQPPQHMPPPRSA